MVPEADYADMKVHFERARAERDRLRAEVAHLRAGISWVRGMCSDEEPLAEIDHTLGEILNGSRASRETLLPEEGNHA